MSESFFGSRREIRQSLESGDVDFNDLTPTGKQAALSLAQERRAEIVERHGRLVVTPKRARAWVRALTAGLRS